MIKQFNEVRNYLNFKSSISILIVNYFQIINAKVI